VAAGSIAASPGRTGAYRLPFVITAASMGTMIEWYDFYIFGSMAFVINQLFFPNDNNLASLLATLATFATGFLVRPFGAVVFGRIGDFVGRKYAFIVTVTVMGGATFLIGLLPTYAQIGALAPLLLVVLRLLQGLALGGEYGGAAIYVAEHAPDNRRGYYTSFIQTTATVGLFVSLLVVLGTRLGFGADDLRLWAWRIPFLLSAILVAIALYVRWKLRETPLFTRLKEAGQTSKSPLKDSLGSGAAWKMILLVLFGATAGEAVVWYAGQFYALTVLQTQLGVPLVESNIIVAIALVLGTPFFLVFGHLSDRIGRKPILMAGMLLSITYVPIYYVMQQASKPLNMPLEIAMVFIQMLYVTMVYGPIAAFLVELFPAKIRYTSLSVPYHLGNGWFGGLLPLICVAIYAATVDPNTKVGNIYLPLVYPIGVALVSFLIGTFFLKESYLTRIWDEVGGEEPELATAAAPAVRPGAAPAS
jgi:MFS family permease